MKTYIECYPCFLRQAISAARYAGCKEQGLYEIVQQTLVVLQQQPPGATPPEIASVVHRIVREYSKVEDPYRAEKKKATQKALQLYAELKCLVGTNSGSRVAPTLCHQSPGCLHKAIAESKINLIYRR